MHAGTLLEGLTHKGETRGQETQTRCHAVTSAAQDERLRQGQQFTQVIALRGPQAAVGHTIDHGTDTRRTAAGPHAVTGHDADDSLVGRGVHHQVEGSLSWWRQPCGQLLLDGAALQVEGLHP